MAISAAYTSLIAFIIYTCICFPCTHVGNDKAHIAARRGPILMRTDRSPFFLPASSSTTNTHNTQLITSASVNQSPRKHTCFKRPLMLIMPTTVPIIDTSVVGATAKRGLGHSTFKTTASNTTSSSSRQPNISIIFTCSCLSWIHVGDDKATLTARRDQS